MHALVDADLVVFRCAATVPEHEPLDVATYRVDVLMRQILDATDATTYKAYLTGRNNYRKKLNLEYKANRKDKEPPYWLQDCRKHLQQEWDVEVSEGCEADDLLGINQGEGTVICSLDKDMLTVPGLHYNWTKVEFTNVTQQDALRKFYKQMLIGDVSDNIHGIRGIGPKKADKIVEHLDDEQDMFDVVYDMYNDPERFVMNANCLWIQQKENEIWANRVNLALPDQCVQEVEAALEFMKSLKVTT